VRQPVTFMRECRRIIAPGGTLFLPCRTALSTAGIRDVLPASKGRPHGARAPPVFPATTDVGRRHPRRGLRHCSPSNGGIRRGLRILGVLPRSRRWKNPRAAACPAAADHNGEVVVAAGRKHSARAPSLPIDAVRAEDAARSRRLRPDFQLLLTAR
jgi:hypothetical protein